MRTRSLSHLFALCKSNNIAQGLQTYSEMITLLIIKAGMFFFFFLKKMFHSAWQSSIITSGPSDGASVKAAFNKRYVIWCGRAASFQVACGFADRFEARKKKTDETVLPLKVLSIELGGKMWGGGPGQVNNDLALSRWFGVHMACISILHLLAGQ